jgi:hypothetical protein
VDSMHEPNSGEVILSTVCLALVVLALIELPLPSVLTRFLPPKREKAVLLIGAAGAVGAGIRTAFREGGWRVVGVDPAFRGK